MKGNRGNNRPIKLKIDWNEVYRQDYILAGKTAYIVAKKHKCDKATVLRNFHKLGLVLRKTADHNKGRKLSKEHKQKMSEAHKGFRHSLKSKIKMSESKRGSKSRFWKGGIATLTNLIRCCFKYRQWRSDVFTRDNFTCVLCNIRGGNLEADHYPKKFSDIFQENNIKSLEEALMCEEFWNINNGRTLCIKCHNKTRGRKSKVMAGVA